MTAADEGITGTSAAKREDFLRLMRDCRQGKVDRILVKSISRFARNAQDCIAAVRELKQMGVTVFFEKERINTATMTSEMLLSMMSAFAQEESISISKNMRKGAVMRMKNGTFRLSQAPYGYRCGEESVLIVHEKESKVVQWIFQNYLSGKGLEQIAAELNKQQTPKARTESIWKKNSVLYILTNERYIGNQLFQKSYRDEGVPFKKNYNHGQKRQFYAEDTHEPIISQEMFEKVQTLLEKKQNKYGFSQSGTIYPLSKILYCAECGSKLYHRNSPKGAMWICSKHLHYSDQCKAKGIAELCVYNTFLTLIGKLKQNKEAILKEFIQQIEALRSKDFVSHSWVIKLNERIAELLDQNHTLHRLRAMECIDSAFFISQTNELEQIITQLRAELERYRDINDYKAIIDKTQMILDLLQNADLNIFEPSLFKKMVQQVVVSDKRLRFQLVNELEFQEEIER